MFVQGKTTLLLQIYRAHNPRPHAKYALLYRSAFPQRRSRYWHTVRWSVSYAQIFADILGCALRYRWHVCMYSHSSASLAIWLASTATRTAIGRFLAGAVGFDMASVIVPGSCGVDVNLDLRIDDWEAGNVFTSPLATWSATVKRCLDWPRCLSLLFSSKRGIDPHMSF